MKALEGELTNIGLHYQQQLGGNDQMIQTLTDQVTLWRSKYEALAKLYSQLRTEHLDMLSKYKSMQLKGNSAQEAIDKMERMERDVKTKNLELADMIRERDRARHDVDRMKSVSLILSRRWTCADCWHATESKGGSRTTEARFAICGGASGRRFAIERLGGLYATQQVQPTTRGARDLAFRQYFRSTSS